MSTMKVAQLVAIGLTFRMATALAANVNYAYVVNAADESVWGYRVEGDGSLTPVGITSVSAEPVGITAHPALSVIYVTKATPPLLDGSITAYSVNGNTGVLTELQSVSTKEHPSSVAIDEPGDYAYVVNLTVGMGETVTTYSIDAAGMLTEEDVTLPIDANLVNLVLHPSVLTLYATFFENFQIFIFEINPSDGTPYLYDMLDLDAQPHAFAVHPSGDYGYTALNDDTIATVGIDDNGLLSAPFDSDSVGASGGTALNVAARSGNVYVTNPGTDNIDIFTVGVDGSLTSLTSVAAGTDPAELVFNADSSIAYCVAEGSDEVVRYSVELNGSLTQQGSNTTTGDAPVRMALITVEADEPIPAVSEWGMVAMTLLVLTAGTLVFVRRRTAHA